MHLFIIFILQVVKKLLSYMPLQVQVSSIPLQMHAVQANLQNVVVTICNMDRQHPKDGNGEDAGITI